MDSTLRPRSASEIVDATFRLFRRHAGTFLVFAVAATAPQLLIQLAAALIGGSGPWRNGLGLGGMAALAGATLVGTPLVIAYYAVMMGGFAALADDAVRTDAPDAAAAVRVGLRRAWASLGTGLLAGLATVAGLVLLVLPGLYVAARLVTAIPTCVVEEVGPREAVRRAWARGRGHAGHAFGVLFLMFVLLMVAGGAAGLVSGAATLAGNKALGAVLDFVLGAAATVLVQPLFPLATQLLYYDLRVRTDGYDLERMADALGAPAAASA